MITLNLTKDELDYLRAFVDAELNKANGGLSVAQYLVLLTLDPIPARLRSLVRRMQGGPQTVRLRLKSTEVSALWLLLDFAPMAHHSTWGRNLLGQLRGYLHYRLTQELGSTPE